MWRMPGFPVLLRSHGLSSVLFRYGTEMPSRVFCDSQVLYFVPACGSRCQGQQSRAHQIPNPKPSGCFAKHSKTEELLRQLAPTFRELNGARACLEDPCAFLGAKMVVMPAKGSMIRSLRARCSSECIPSQLYCDGDFSLEA